MTSAGHVVPGSGDGVDGGRLSGLSQSVTMVLLAMVVGGFVGLVVGPLVNWAVDGGIGLYFWTAGGCVLAGIICCWLEIRVKKRL